MAAIPPPKKKRVEGGVKRANEGTEKLHLGLSRGMILVCDPGSTQGEDYSPASALIVSARGGVSPEGLHCDS